MQSQTGKSRRVTKEGCFFTGLRVSGLLLKILGALTLLGGIFGFGSSLFKSWADLAAFPQYADQQMAQFIVFLILGWLGVFVAIGCTGLGMIGIGFGLDLAATEKVPALPEAPIDKPLSPA